MSIHILLLVATLAGLTAPRAAEEVTLHQALKAGQISLTAKGSEGSTHYLKPVTLTLRNRSGKPLNIKVASGLWFNSADSNVQDMITTDTEWLALAPGETKSYPINGMCIQSRNAAPGSTDAYVYGGPATPKLNRMAQKIDSANWHNSQAQMALWAVANNNGVDPIFCYGDDVEFKIMCEAAKVLGLPAPSRQSFEQRAAQPIRYKAELKGKFSFTFSEKVPIHIALFDTNGIVLKEIYREEATPGKHTVEYTFDAYPYQGQTIYAKFIAFDDVLMTRTIAL
jgi:hypothetical protein